MAAESPIKACIDLYETLSAVNFPSSVRPPIYFDQPPTYDGGQLRPTYVVLKDNGVNTESNADFESNVVDTGSITLEVYADTLAGVDLVVKCIRFNGLPPSSRGGFDFGTLAMSDPFYHMSLHRKTETRSVAGIGVNSQRTHMARLEYTIMTGVTA